MKLVNTIQYNIKNGLYNQSYHRPKAMYSLQYEYYKLLCLKFCIIWSQLFFNRCSLSFLPQKFELFVIVITDINSFIE